MHSVFSALGAAAWQVHADDDWECMVSGSRRAFHRFQFFISVSIATTAGGQLDGKRILSLAKVDNVVQHDLVAAACIRRHSISRAYCITGHFLQSLIWFYSLSVLSSAPWKAYGEFGKHAWKGRTGTSPT
jgi:hypothetical protein